MANPTPNSSTEPNASYPEPNSSATSTPEGDSSNQSTENASYPDPDSSSASTPEASASDPPAPNSTSADPDSSTSASSPESSDPAASTPAGSNGDPAQNLQGAGADADQNAGPENVGDPAPCPVENPDAQPKPGALIVTVTNSADGTIIQGATVSVSSPSGSASATTDESGTSTFNPLNPDSYQVTASQTDFSQESSVGAAVPAGSVSSPVTARVQLTPALAHIAVQVVDDHGNPVEGVAVSLDGQSRNGMTDTGGNFDFGEVAPGSYTVSGTKKGYMPSPAADTRDAAANAETQYKLTLTAKCCGCVNDVVIQNVQSFTTPPITRGGATVANGHSFDLVITMTFTGCAGGATADCTLEWWEKTNIPALAVTANTWTDMFAAFPTSPTFAPWNNRIVPCPAGGNLTVTIVDIPSLGNPPGVTQTRVLEFRLTVKSGNGCACSLRSKTASATQTLQMVNGLIVAAGTSFQIQ